MISQAALIEGDLQDAGALADSTLAAAHRLHFDRHYFNFHAIRTTALLALERRDLAAAAEPVERALAMVSGARPFFNYLAQLDRVRIWAVGGNLDEALSSLLPLVTDLELLALVGIVDPPQAVRRGSAANTQNHPGQGDDTSEPLAQDRDKGSNRAGPDRGHASQPAA